MWRAGRKEEAQRVLNTSTDPYASYYHGLILKELAEEELRKDVGVYESRSAANLLLNKSKDSLFVTLDRLRSPKIVGFHPLDRKLAEVIERVEHKLDSLVNVSVANGHSAVELDESDDKEFTTPQQVTSTPFRRSLIDVSSLRNGGGSRLDISAARVEARPSPERLDAQLRQMVLKQVTTSRAKMNLSRIFFRFVWLCFVLFFLSALILNCTFRKNVIWQFLMSSNKFEMNCARRKNVIWPYPMSSNKFEVKSLTSSH